MKQWVSGMALMGALAGCAFAPSHVTAPRALVMNSDESRIQLTSMTSGTVVRRNECLRIATPTGSSTLVWPYGSTVTAAGAVALPNGKTIGAGDTVRLGGGQRDTLPASLTGRRATACPGPYWIVADRIDA